MSVYLTVLYCNLYFFSSMPRIFFLQGLGGWIRIRISDDCFFALSKWFSTRDDFPPAGDIEQCLETFWVVTTGVRGFWCYSYLGARDAAKHPKCTGLALTTNRYLVLNGNSAKIQKPYYPHVIHTQYSQNSNTNATTINYNN